MVKRDKTKNTRLGLVLACGVAGMLGLAFASVPLYQLFCQVTGYGGTPRTDVAREGVPAQAAEGAAINVMFDANVNTHLAWQFKPDINDMDVHPGVETLAIFHARNIGDHTVVGTATFNVTPVKAAQYVAKTECFCFTEQKLAAGEEASMPVSFYIDPEILSDPNTQDVQDIVLSYTFHPAVDATAALETETESPADGG